jgi:penicillin-binding protein-related factor A (putative recombinase)
MTLAPTILGRATEAQFENELNMKRIGWVRVPDGCKIVGRGRLIRIKSPFDYIASLNGKNICVDVKHTMSEMFPVGKINKEQVGQLLRVNHGGYMVYCKPKHCWYFIPVRQLKKAVDIHKSIQLSEIAQGQKDAVSALELGLEPEYETV